MRKITVKNPIVEIDGDEMTRVIWKQIRERLILPYLDIDLKYFDLQISKRDETDDRITMEAAKAIKVHGVGIKCATITPNHARVKEFDLKKEYKSPNGTIRNYLGGTIFRAPIVIENIPRLIPAWKKPIVVARHAHADQYKATEILVDGSGRLDLSFEPHNMTPGSKHTVHEFDESGIGLAMYNTRASIKDFARACFRYSLLMNYPIYFSAKETILKVYDAVFRDIFEETFDQEFRVNFEEKGLSYTYKLIDDMVARVLKMDGGFIWALKNYDGDVMSDMVAQGFGSLGLMTSVLMCPDGKTVETEAAHGTVTRHFRLHEEGEQTSTNPIASIFAWTRGLVHRGQFDNTPEVVAFAKLLECVCIETVEAGTMTKDLARVVEGVDNPPRDTWCTTDEFFDMIEGALKEKMLAFSQSVPAHIFVQ